MPAPAAPGRGTRPTIAPVQEGSGAGAWWAGIVLVLVAAAILYFTTQREPVPDPHYLRAVMLVDHYEQTTNADQRDYHDDAYTKALAEIDLVSADSISAPDAHRMAAKIERHTKEQDGASHEVRNRRAEAQQAAREREALAERVAEESAPTEADREQ